MRGSDCAPHSDAIPNLENGAPRTTFEPKLGIVHVLEASQDSTPHFPSELLNPSTVGPPAHAVPVIFLGVFRATNDVTACTNAPTSRTCSKTCNPTVSGALLRSIAFELNW